MTLFLVRHGDNDWLPRGLAGRTIDVGLNQNGLQQAEMAGMWLRSQGVASIYSSPLRRTVETAEIIASTCNAPSPVLDEDLTEMDFGRWSGKSFEEIQSHAEWNAFNTFRIGNRAPEGELMIEVQQRMVSACHRLIQASDGPLTIVSHGDPIRTVLLHFLGAPLDHFDRLEISPASISALELHSWGTKALFTNRTFT